MEIGKRVVTERQRKNYAFAVEQIFLIRRTWCVSVSVALNECIYFNLRNLLFLYVTMEWQLASNR